MCIHKKLLPQDSRREKDTHGDVESPRSSSALGLKTQCIFIVLKFLIGGSSEVIGDESPADSPETEGGGITSSLEAFF